MSWSPLLDPQIPIGDAVDAIEAVIVPRARDLGGFEVRRALPSAQRQMVGPFIFFDGLGAAVGGGQHRDRAVGQRQRHSARAAASTSATWPSTFTLRQTRAIRPAPSISTVVRSIPM